jgi:hypothetical protein
MERSPRRSVLHSRLKLFQLITVALSNGWRRSKLSQTTRAQQKIHTSNTGHSILLPSKCMDPRIRVLVAKPGLDSLSSRFYRGENSATHRRAQAMAPDHETGKFGGFFPSKMDL